MKLWILMGMLLLLSGCAGTILELGVGGAILPRVPGDIMTGREQFHISAALVKPITKWVKLRGAWDHYSNGADLGIGRHPNKGFDAGSAQFILIIK